MWLIRSIEHNCHFLITCWSIPNQHLPSAKAIEETQQGSLGIGENFSERICLALPATVSDVEQTPTFILDFQMHCAQHIQYTVHDAGVCGSNNWLTRQIGQGGYSLDLVQLEGMKSSLPNSLAAWQNRERVGSRESLKFCAWEEGQIWAAKNWLRESAKVATKPSCLGGIQSGLVATC